ncbi:Ref family recombination enhancement nuclease [Thermomonas mangrovi]|uniref:Ref family recombination enhancement nuclease n=1 Tax=Thermomonas mangrovi TaxID=2993316 RepID=UPI002307F646|nr:Ref family recombination enhancement nuclease [Thermomonas mangrovi]
MKRGRSTGNQTVEEAAWIRDVKKIGCLCCMAKGYRWDEDGPLAEAHHLLSGGIRRGHLFTVGLCAWHHRGVKAVDGWSIPMHRRKLGPSLMDGSVTFRAAFGDDESLLGWQRELVKAHRRAAA